MEYILCSSAVRVHDSQAYRKVDVTRERISRILELREMLLSFQTGEQLGDLYSSQEGQRLQEATNVKHFTICVTLKLRNDFIRHKQMQECTIFLC